MTNYNEKLDEVLDFIENYGVSASTEGFDKTTSRTKAKQAITSLMKELVAEARIDELKHLVNDYGIWHQDMARQFPQKITLNQRIKELEAWTN